MPPKPWLTKTGPPREDVSAIIQSNPTMKQQIPKLSAQSPIIGPQTAEQNSTSNVQNGLTNPATGLNSTTGLGTTAGYGSMGTGYGSSYGGYGSGYGSSYGGYGGYGSSYGGYGGYGSSYGGYGGYGMGMGYGRMGMMGNDPNQKGFVMNTLITLESFGFLIGSFCQIGRSLDQNIQGLSLFYNSFKNLFVKIYNGIKNGFSWLGQKTKNGILHILDFIKTYILFMKHQDPHNRMKSLKLIINISVVALILTMYPLCRKFLAKAG